MYEDADISMQGFVIDCASCHRLLVYPIHRQEFLQDWNKHGRLCLKCVLRLNFADKGLEGYIIEAITFVHHFSEF